MGTGELAECIRREQARLPPGVLEVPSMLSYEERALLHWAGREGCGAEGQLVDAGSYLGGSTLSLACGLRASGDTDGRRVHAYDRFRVGADWSGSISRTTSTSRSVPAPSGCTSTTPSRSPSWSRPMWATSTAFAGTAMPSPPSSWTSPRAGRRTTTWSASSSRASRRGRWSRSRWSCWTATWTISARSATARRCTGCQAPSRQRP